MLPEPPPFAVVAMDPTGRFTYFAGSQEDCGLWRMLQGCNAWRAHCQHDAAERWVAPSVSAVLPRETLEAQLREAFGAAFTLAASPALPRWRAYGFDLTQPGERPPPVVPFDAAHPNDTGHCAEFLLASAGVGPGGVVGRLAVDWRSHASGNLAVITPNARDITALYVRTAAP